MMGFREASNENLHVNIVGIGNNAYRLTLFDESTRFTKKLILTGTETKTALPPGSYQVMLESVDRSLSIDPFIVEIDRNNQTLDLTDKLPTIYRQIDSSSKKLTIQMTNLRYSDMSRIKKLPIQMTNLRYSDMSRSKKSPMQMTNLSSSDISQGIGVGSLEGNPDYSMYYEFSEASEPDYKPSQLDSLIRSKPKSHRFVIGISEDMKPGRQGGWEPVGEELNVDHELLDNGRFQLRFKTDRINSEKRVRATFAIQGKPAIRLPVPLYKPGVSIEFQPVLDLNGLDILVFIIPDNPLIKILTSAIDNLSESEAESLLRRNGLTEENVTDIFYYKWKDPWAATAAAVLLTSLRKLEPIFKWAYNLEKMTPYISDPAIVAAWAQVVEPELSSEEKEKKILEHLVLGRQRGAPTFVITNSLAMDLLSILATSATTATIRRQAKKEYNKWSDRGKRRIYAGSYLVWEQTGDNLQDGKLPSRRYTIIKQGYLSDRGFDF